MRPLDPSLRALAADLVALRVRAQALGLFTDDRELLICPGCGLMEDVAASGILITCREPDLGQDTGLRFEPLGEQTFRCPACGRKVNEPLPEDGTGNESPAPDAAGPRRRRNGLAPPTSGL
jgi:hypothetical protein